MLMDVLPTLVGYHDGQSTTHGNTGSVTGMVAVLGVLATAAWMVFSTLSFRITAGIAAAAWAAGVAYLVLA